MLFYNIPSKRRGCTRAGDGVLKVTHLSQKLTERF